jgi:comEA protein
MIVNVFTTSQVKNMSVKEEIKEECICPVLDCSKCFNSTIIDGNSNNDLVPDQNIESNNKISLNNSTKEELMTLIGVGESKAEAIIEYRNKNNGFKNIEEIMNVSGIGEAAYNKIKDNITL